MAKAESKEEEVIPEPVETEKAKKSKKKTTDSEKPFLETISGIGPTTRTRLEEAGYGSKESIALATKAQLTEISGIAEKTAALLIREARARFDLGLKKGTEYEAAAKTRVKLTSSSKAFDELLGGGFETGSVTELAGENGCGKTQIAHQLAVNCVKELDQDVIWIDTEGTFRFNRIVQIAEAAGIDPDTVLSRITVGRAYNSEHDSSIYFFEAETQLHVKHPEMYRSFCDYCYLVCPDEAFDSLPSETKRQQLSWAEDAGVGIITISKEGAARKRLGAKQQDLSPEIRNEVLRMMNKRYRIRFFPLPLWKRFRKN